MTSQITTALLTTLMHGAEPMVLTDPALPDHPMIAVNPAFEALTGYSAAETLGRNCRFLQGEATDPATPARIRRCLAEQRGCVEWIVNYRRDGSRFWNLLFLSPVFDHDGRLLHFFGNQRDITEGPSFTVGDYSLGKADIPQQGRHAFEILMREIMEVPAMSESRDADRARTLTRIVAAAHRLNDVTTRLEPARWAPPG